MVELKVIGELRDDPHPLLLLGSDGHSYGYGYGIISGAIRELEPDDCRAVDVVGHVAQQLKTNVGKVVSSRSLHTRSSFAYRDSTRLVTQGSLSGSAWLRASSKSR
jgi:hypothetical protein